MDVDGPFGERALLLFTVIGSKAISFLYVMSWSLFFDNSFIKTFFSLSWRKQQKEG